MTRRAGKLFSTGAVRHQQQPAAAAARYYDTICYYIRYIPRLPYTFRLPRLPAHLHHQTLPASNDNKNSYTRTCTR